MENKENSTKVVIGEVRFSYLHVFEPWKPDDNSREQYTATLLIPKSDTATVEKVKNAIKAAFEKAVVDKWGGKRPVKWFNPLQDGDQPKDNGDDRGESYHGCWYLNAKSGSRPGVVDVKRQPILNSEDIWSGCYGYASIAFGGFTYGGKTGSGNMGISCYLNNLLMSRKGEALGSGKTSAEEDFKDLPFGGETDESLF